MVRPTIRGGRVSTLGPDRKQMWKLWHTKKDLKQCFWTKCTCFWTHQKQPWKVDSVRGGMSTLTVSLTVKYLFFLWWSEVPKPPKFKFTIRKHHFPIPHPPFHSSAPCHYFYLPYHHKFRYLEFWMPFKSQTSLSPTCPCGSQEYPRQQGRGRLRGRRAFLLLRRINMIFVLVVITEH